MARFDTIFPFSRLRKGKFRNASFFILKDGDTTGGRKTVTHEYPNSDRRFVEDLGGRKEIYNLEIYVQNTQNLNQINNLKSALNEKGTGKLIHPFFGQKTVTVIGWTLFVNFGWARFNVTFEQSDPAVLPLQQEGNKSLLNKIKDLIKGEQNLKIATLYYDLNNNYKSFTKRLTQVQNFSEQLLEVANATLNVTSELATLTDTLNDTLDNTALLLKTPSLIANRISNIFTQFELIGSRTIDQFNATKQLFGFGEDDTDTKTNTANQRQIIQNNTTLNVAIRSNALALAYTEAVNIDYNDNQQLQDTIGILEDEYQSLILIADLDTIDLLQDLRSQAGLIFEQLQNTVPKIYTVFLNSYQNIHQIVYNYYGNFANSNDFEEKVTQIYQLNSFINPSKIRGEIKLLTS